MNFVISIKVSNLLIDFVSEQIVSFMNVFLNTFCSK